MKKILWYVLILSWLIPSLTYALNNPLMPSNIKDVVNVPVSSQQPIEQQIQEAKQQQQVIQQQQEQKQVILPWITQQQQPIQQPIQQSDPNKQVILPWITNSAMSGSLEPSSTATWISSISLTSTWSSKSKVSWFSFDWISTWWIFQSWYFYLSLLILVLVYFINSIFFRWEKIGIKIILGLFWVWKTFFVSLYMIFVVSYYETRGLTYRIITNYDLFFIPNNKIIRYWWKKDILDMIDRLTQEQLKFEKKCYSKFPIIYQNLFDENEKLKDKKVTNFMKFNKFLKENYQLKDKFNIFSRFKYYKDAFILEQEAKKIITDHIDKKVKSQKMFWLMDEAHNFYPARNWIKELLLPEQTFYTQLRKFNIFMFMITQTIKQIDVYFPRLSTVVTDLERFFFIVLETEYFILDPEDFTLDRDPLIAKNVRKLKTRWRLAPKYYAKIIDVWYNTNKLIFNKKDEFTEDYLNNKEKIDVYYNKVLYNK